jgi:phage baseplate assembly protein V
MSHMRFGVVAEQDVSGCRVRVRFPDRDELTSWWLPIVVPKTQNDKAYYLPDLGEQVVCLMDAYDEDGVVLGAIYSSADPTTPGMTADKLNWTAKDGGSLEYDRAAHRLSVSLPSGGSVNIAANGASIVIDASGNVTVTAGGTILLSSAAGAPIQLGSAAVKGVARLGDTVVCPAGTGTIKSASAVVLAE